MSEFLNLGILLDSSKSQSDLRSVESTRQQVEQGLNQTDQHAKQTWMTAVRVVRAGWGILSNVLEMAGVSISQVTRAVMQSMIMIGQSIANIAAAEALTPGMQIAATMTLVQAGVLVASAYQMEYQSKEAGKELKNTQQAMRAMNMLIGAVNF